MVAKLCAVLHVFSTLFHISELLERSRRKEEEMRSLQVSVVFNVLSVFADSAETVFVYIPYRLQILYILDVIVGLFSQ